MSLKKSLYSNTIPELGIIVRDLDRYIKVIIVELMCEQHNYLSLWLLLVIVNLIIYDGLPGTLGKFFFLLPQIFEKKKKLKKN